MAKGKKEFNLASAGFKVGGQLYSTVYVPLPVARAIEVLEKLPFKELLTTRQLAESIGIQKPTFGHYAPHSAMSPYRFDCGKQSKGLLWGSSRTISELRRQLERE